MFAVNRVFDSPVLQRPNLLLANLRNIVIFAQIAMGHVRFLLERLQMLHFRFG